MDLAYGRHSVNACALLQLQWTPSKPSSLVSTSPRSGSCFGMDSASFPASFPVVRLQALGRQVSGSAPFAETHTFASNACIPV